MTHAALRLPRHRRIARGSGVAALVLLAAALPGHAQTLPDVKEVLDYVDDLYRANSSRAVMRMTVVRERGERSLEMEAWSRGEDESLVVIRGPAREAGAATLRTTEGLWNYAPRADRLIRIPSGLLAESWMGSHFTNDDLMRETSYLDDYDAVLEPVEVEGRAYLRVTLTPKPDAPVVYTRLVFFLNAFNWLPLRAEYWDESRVIRTMTFEDVRTVGGRQIPMRMVLQPADEPLERTVVEYLELEFDVAVDPTLFTRQGLRRVARG